MKKNRMHITAVACAMLALTGCVKPGGWTSGNTVKFGAGTQGGDLTKTAYGATFTDSGTGKRVKQMIDWRKDDIIRIACAQASTIEGSPVAADYIATADGVQFGSTSESRTTLALATGINDKGLRWGSTETLHTFYAVYPSPSERTAYGDGLTTAGILTGTIPEEQNYVSISSAAPYTAAPDMKNEYLVAMREVAAGKQSFGSDEVFLYFTPITTAIEFSVKNAMDAPLAISSIEILSAGHNLSGKFTMSLAGLCQDGSSYIYPSLTTTSGTEKAAHVSFGTEGLTLQKDELLTFTIFLLPEDDLDDLTFRINKKGTGAGYIQTALKYSTTGNPFIEFDRCKKHFISGLLAKDGARWTVCFDPDVHSWDVLDDVNGDLGNPDAAEDPGLISWDEGGNYDMPLYEIIPEGALAGAFSVSDTKKVHFSKGNLYYDGSGWQFENNQYDHRLREGEDARINGTLSTTPSGHCGAFGWVGASSAFTGVEQYGVSSNTSSAPYGNVPGEPLKADWGIAYCESNGVSPNTTWFTLSADEWQYLLSSGSYENGTRAGLYSQGVTVAGVPYCLVLYPDGFTGTKATSPDFTTYDTEEEWAAAQNKGVVCLPPSGYHHWSGEARDFEISGLYLSSTKNQASYSKSLYFIALSITPDNGCYVLNGYSVRLVTGAK